MTARRRSTRRHPPRRAWPLTALACVAVAASGHGALPPRSETQLVSVPAGGGSGGGGGTSAGFPSDSGRFVAFWGHASDLVPDDDNGTADVFVRDVVAGTTELVSVRDGGGGSANGFSFGASISATGRYVAFSSEATNLVALDGAKPGRVSPFRTQVYLRDRTAGTTRLVSVDAAGTGPADGYCGSASVSADGRFVAFISDATNLVPEDPNGAYDVYVRDMKLGVTRLVSVRADGTGPGDAESAQGALSANGRFVAFSSHATDLLAGGASGQQVYVRDLRKGVTRLASVTESGDGGNEASTTPSISPDGRFVAFESRASDLAPDDANDADDVFVRDMRKGTVRLASPNASGTGTGDRYSEDASVSANGRRVVFYSYATDLVSMPHDGNEHVYLRDLAKRRTTLLTVTAGGTGFANGGSWRPRITPNGKYAVWDSDATDLVEGGTSSGGRVYIRRVK